MTARNIRRAATTLVGLVLVILVLHWAGPANVAKAFQQTHPAFLVLGFLSYASFLVLRGARWRLLLQRNAPQATLRETTSLSAMGWLISTFIPMKAGDVTRTLILSAQHRQSVATVGATVAVERALDVVGIALAASFGLAAGGFFAGKHMPPAVAQAVAFAWIAPLLGLVFLFLWGRRVRGQTGGNRFVRFARRFLEAIHEAATDRRNWIKLALLTLAVTAAQCAVYVFFILSFDPSVPYSLVAAGVPLFLLTFIISFTPGNIGSYEAAFVFVYVLFGLEASRLLPIGVALHLLTIGTVTILGGAAFLLYRQNRHVPSTAARVIEAPPPPPPAGLLPQAVTRAQTVEEEPA